MEGARREVRGDGEGDGMTDTPLLQGAYNVPDAGRYLGISESSMWALLSERPDRFGNYKIKGRRVVYREDLDGYLAEVRASAA